MSDLMVSYGEQLVRWHRCWIRADLLERIAAAGRALPEAEAADVLGALIDELAGLEVRTVEQIPALLRRALSL